MCKKVILKIAGGNKHSDEKMSLKNVSFLYSGAMVRASAFHVLACRFNPRYCESVRQCSSMVTVLPDQVELHPSQFCFGQSCRQGR